MTRRIGFRPLSVWVLLVQAPLLRAAPLQFDFRDPKGVNSILFVLDSLLEPFVGVCSGISGTLTFDPDRPEHFQGSVTVQAASLHLEHPGMKKTLHGPDWLDVEKYPTIEFTIERAEDVRKSSEGAVELNAIGTMTCHGESRPLRVPVRVQYLAGQLGRRVRGVQGDLLVIRGEFTIHRKEFKINPSSGSDIVSDLIEIRVAIAGGRVTGESK